MLAPDGKMRLTDVADTEQLFRLIQSVPSKKAEPFKQWMAEVASQRLDQMADPVFFLCSYVVESFWEIGYLSEYIHDLLDDEKNYRYYDVIRLRQMAYDAAKEGRLTKKDVNGTQWKTAIKELELEKGAIEHFWD